MVMSSDDSDQVDEELFYRTRRMPWRRDTSGVWKVVDSHFRNREIARSRGPQIRRRVMGTRITDREPVPGLPVNMYDIEWASSQEGKLFFMTHPPKPPMRWLNERIDIEQFMYVPVGRYTSKQNEGNSRPPPSRRDEPMSTGRQDERGYYSRPAPTRNEGFVQDSSRPRSGGGGGSGRIPQYHAHEGAVDYGYGGGGGSGRIPQYHAHEGAVDYGYGYGGYAVERGTSSKRNFARSRQGPAYSGELEDFTEAMDCIDEGEG